MSNSRSDAIIASADANMNERWSIYSASMPLTTFTMAADIENAVIRSATEPGKKTQFGSVRPS